MANIALSHRASAALVSGARIVRWSILMALSMHSHQSAIEIFRSVCPRKRPRRRPSRRHRLRGDGHAYNIKLDGVDVVIY